MVKKYQPKDFIGQAESKIIAIHETDLKLKCARALRLSLLVDVDNSRPRPKSPEEIMNDTGVPIYLQRNYNICLTKDDAIEFLYHLTRVCPKNFHRSLTKKSYKSFFDRKVSSGARLKYSNH